MSQGYPPPPGQYPQQPQQPQQPYQQWPQQGPGWGAPMPPRKPRRLGLIITLSVLGGLLVLGGLAALMVSAMSIDPVEHSSVSAEPSEGGAPGKDPKEKEGAPEPGVPAPAENPAEDDTDAEADVKLSGCEVNSLTKWPSVNAEIMNNGTAKASYVVNVEFVDGAGTRLAEGMAVASDLAPGQKSTQKAQGLGEVPKNVKCKVAKVTRYPSGG
ncbi:FxLYD domain-containing protein [Streptomyces sp. NPDC014734]|uniref:FxLYD domain-containing protein n=1 Tax=Streptomyces sp. NPDC014734 TaxID=3364886 RepID=UPI0036FC4E3F